MYTIIDAIQGIVPVQSVAAQAALDVVAVVVAVAAVAAVSALLERLITGVIALVAGGGSAMVIEGYLTYPGVVYHELSHALFAVLTGAKVHSISLRRRPSADGSGRVLGSVSFSSRGNRVAQAVQRAVTGIAPLVTGVAAMVFITRVLLPACTEVWQQALAGYLFLCVLLHTSLSREDLRRIREGAPIVLAVLFIVFLFAPFDPQALAASILAPALSFAPVAALVPPADAGLAGVGLFQ